MHQSIFIFLAIIKLVLSQSSCDDELIILQSSFGHYVSESYSPPQPDLLWSKMNSIRASVEATYLLCFNKIYIDIIDRYPPNSSNCLYDLDSLSITSLSFGHVPISQIKEKIDKISDVIHQTMADCKEILYFNETNGTYTNSCIENTSNINNLISQYSNERIIGNSGKEFLKNITILLEKERRNCEFRSIAKPGNKQILSCDQCNDFFGYVVEFMENKLDSKNYLKFFQYFRFYYQNAIRTTRMCQNMFFENVE